MTARVDPDAVWLRWVEPSYWPLDDAETRAAGYDEAGVPSPSAWDDPPGGAQGRIYGAQRTNRAIAPQPGGTGWFKPARGPLSHFTVVRADREEGRFDTQVRFPGATMHVEHRLNPPSAGQQVMSGRSGISGAPDAAAAGAGRHSTYELVHRVRFTGPAAAVWANLIGRTVAAGFLAVMANIIERSQPDVSH